MTAPLEDADTGDLIAELERRGTLVASCLVHDGAPYAAYELAAELAGEPGDDETDWCIPGFVYVEAGHEGRVERFGPLKPEPDA